MDCFYGSFGSCIEQIFDLTSEVLTKAARSPAAHDITG
jgi:hypothetical protein